VEVPFGILRRHIDIQQDLGSTFGTLGGGPEHYADSVIICQGIQV
jgi:hypothetical protein